MATWEDLIGGGLSIYDYAKGQQDARDVSQNLSKGYTQGINTIKSYSDPYAQAGLPGIQQYNQLLQNPQSITQTPGYQFNLQQQNQALERSAAAKGNLMSGQNLNNLMQYTSGYASNEYDKALQRAKGLIDVGAVSAGQAGRNIAELFSNQGEANALREAAQGTNRKSMIEGVMQAASGLGLDESAISGIGGGDFMAGIEKLGSFLGIGGAANAAAGTAAAGMSAGGATATNGLAAMGTGGLPNGAAAFGAPSGFGSIGAGAGGASAPAGAAALGPLAYLGGGVLGNIGARQAFENVGTTEGTVGSVAGGALGSIFGPFGTGVGSFLGGGIGGALAGEDKDNVDGDFVMVPESEAANMKDGVSSTGAYGTVGFWGPHTRNITKERLESEFKPIFTNITQTDDAIASMLTPEQNAQVKAYIQHNGWMSNFRDNAVGMWGASMDLRQKALQSVLGDQYTAQGWDSIFNDLRG